MVRAVDFEALLQKYVEEDSLEKADALYLLYTLGPSGAAKTLSARYGVSGPLSSVLQDLRALGADVDFERSAHYQVTEDTREYVKDVVTRAFEKLCIDKLKEAVKARAPVLSPTAKAVLYLIIAFYPERVNSHILYLMYKFVFKEELTDKDWKRVWEELAGCYASQRTNFIDLPPYFDLILPEFRGVIPSVEVKVSWPKKEE